MTGVQQARLVWDAVDDPAVAEAISLCFQCGACTASCPLNIFNGSRLNPRQALRRMQLGLPADADPYLCMMCAACEAVCPRGVRITDVMHWLRRRLYQQNQAPQRLVQALWSVYEEGNPWGYPAKDRGKWLLGIDAPTLRQKADILLYVGCISSYDVRLQRAARALASLLSKAGVEFAVLGERERCCGDAVFNAGEMDFLEELIQENINAFKEKGASTVITISPHCYRMMRFTYPKYGADFTVMHYTEYLAQLVDNNRLRINGDANMSITYHDPCYLGRYARVYEEPRRLLESMRGARLEEMQLARDLALCCGGGGGRIMMETKPEERPSNMRVKQAAETGAEILATSCPYCIINFEDSVKLQRMQLKVMDVAEILNSMAEGR